MNEQDERKDGAEQPPQLRIAWLGRDFDGFGFEGRDGKNIILYLNAVDVAKIEKLISADSPGV